MFYYYYYYSDFETWNLLALMEILDFMIQVMVTEDCVQGVI